MPTRPTRRSPPATRSSHWPGPGCSIPRHRPTAADTLHPSPSNDPDMNPLDITKDLLRQTLQLGERANSLTADTPLLGNFPEFNSLTVVSLLSTMEEQLGIEVDDDEINEDLFRTVGSLSNYIDAKLA
ncbi:MAG: acyl carrier protein [Proteobacteria bacterium]|nr:MAG: acyl carrier protein [Pseudomonadota bacterium]